MLRDEDLDKYVPTYTREALASEAQYLRRWSDAEVWEAAAPGAQPWTQEGFDCAVARYELQRREREAKRLERERAETERVFQEVEQRFNASVAAITAQARERRRFAADQVRKRKVAVRAQADQAKREHLGFLQQLMRGE